MTSLAPLPIHPSLSPEARDRLAAEVASVRSPELRMLAGVVASEMLGDAQLALDGMLAGERPSGVLTYITRAPDPSPVEQFGDLMQYADRTVRSMQPVKHGPVEWVLAERGPVQWDNSFTIVVEKSATRASFMIHPTTLGTMVFDSAIRQVKQAGVDHEYAPDMAIARLLCGLRDGSIRP